jgi:hypothetical protein
MLKLPSAIDVRVGGIMTGSDSVRQCLPSPYTAGTVVHSAGEGVEEVCKRKKVGR